MHPARIKLFMFGLDILMYLQQSQPSSSFYLPLTKTSYTVADLEKGRAGSAPPPLGDGMTPSLTVMLANVKCWSFYTVKQRIQNIQNDCHQWLSDSFRVRKICFRPRLRPEPRWGSLQCSARPSSWFKGLWF